MKIAEIENNTPKTPEQVRVDVLKNKKDKAMDAYKVEKERQKKQKAREKIAKAQKILLPTNATTK